MTIYLRRPYWEVLNEPDLELTKMGIDVAGESQLVGFPSMFPDVSMINWETGNPNVRYWVLKLIKDNLGPGDQLVETHPENSGIVSQAFITPKGRRLLLINKRNKEMKITLPAEAKGSFADYVNVATNELLPAREGLMSNVILLKPFEVAVIQWK